MKNFKIAKKPKLLVGHKLLKGLLEKRAIKKEKKAEKGKALEKDEKWFNVLV